MEGPLVEGALCISHIGLYNMTYFIFLAGTKVNTVEKPRLFARGAAGVLPRGKSRTVS